MNFEFCIENEKLCIMLEELCIKNEESCINNDALCRAGHDLAALPGAVWGEADWGGGRAVDLDIEKWGC